MTRFKISKKSYEKVIKQIQKKTQKIASNIKTVLISEKNSQISSSINIIISLKAVKVIQNTTQVIASNIKATLTSERVSQTSSASYIMMLSTSKLESVNINIINSNTDMIESSFNVSINNIFMINIVSEFMNYENKDNNDINMLTDNKKYNKDENTNL